jgi:multiple antibiotic resistance protein
MNELNFSWVQTGTATMILFAVIDIIGSIPVIIEIKRKSGGEIHEERASLVSMIIMIGFLFLGESILNIIGINVNSFAVAGSFVLFFMSLEMVLGVKIFREEVTSKVASIVPLAFPIIAGAGTMTSLISLRAEFEIINIIIAIIINIAIVYAVLRSINFVERLLGQGGIAVVRKVFGIILMAIAVKLFSTNIKQLFV